jgi:hypothetical protein
MARGSWRFTRAQSRVFITLPKSLGGHTHELAFEGGYTFAALGARSSSRGRHPGTICLGVM